MANIEEIKKRNIERVNHWEWTWNNDPMRMADECYAEDCKVFDMIGGNLQKGREQLKTLEKMLMEADPSRKMTVTNIISSENKVALEADMSWANGTISEKACIFLTFNEDGFIIEDHTYTKPLDGILTK